MRRKLNEEVILAEDPILKVDGAEISQLVQEATRNRRGRIRLCAHLDIQDRVHEMLIVHSRDAYVRPHKHLFNIESFHVIEGLADIVIFNEDGIIREVISIGDYASGKFFYYRLSKAHYHTLVIRSDVLVFHETTGGPFDRTNTVFAPWSPEDDDEDGIRRFMLELKAGLRRPKK